MTISEQAPSVLPEKKIWQTADVFLIRFLLRTFEFTNIVAFKSIMDLQQMNTLTKAKLVYTITKAEKPITYC